MKTKNWHRLLFSLLGLGMIGFLSIQSDAFFLSLTKISHTARATMGTGPAFSIQTDQLPPLPPSAFYGKNVAIPVSVSGSSELNPKDVKLMIAYQLYDTSNNPIGSIGRSDVTLSPDPVSKKKLEGAAFIQRSELVSIQNGGRIAYWFSGSMTGGGNDLVLSQGGLTPAPPGAGDKTLPPAAFSVSITNSWVGFLGPEGTQIDVPDLSSLDGNTSVTIPAGAVSSHGQLDVRQENPAAWPPGPREVVPLVVNSMRLSGATLSRPATLTMTYPATPQGKVVDTDYNGSDLALYLFDGFAWRLVGRPRVDTTLHTLTVSITEFGVFALIPTGAIGASDIRPAQRIITPNDDGINDFADFMGVAENEDVKIFDIRGRRVCTLQGPNPKWYGRDDDGRTVESGVYIYQYVSQGDRVSGVIAVAK